MKVKLTLLLCLLSATVLAGPARSVTSSTFQTQAPCGPLWDSMALQGQWFMDPLNGATNVNAWEYCDDTNSLTIVGVATNIGYSTPGNPLSNIMSFDVLATVNNNLPVDYDYVLNATNSHGEVQQQPVSAGAHIMDDTRITAEFAIADVSMVPSSPAPPYWPDPVSGGAYHIEAVNEDLRAWYCWDPNSGQQPAGQFQVPAWNLVPSTIPPGGSAQVTMKFTVTGSGIPISDYRHSVIRASATNGWDVLYNRHPSLKISHWLDTLLIDNGYNYASTPPAPWWEEEPVEYIYASDASVFYNVEQPELPNKMHWPQLPDPNGWDVRACYSTEDGKTKVLADDFMCTSNGPITHITFWGSWLFDEFEEQDPYQGINNIHLSIHRDIPDPDPANPVDYSMPQVPPEQIWEFDPNNIPANWNFTITPEDPSMQGWYDPNTGQFFPNNHTNYFRYDVWIPADEAFVQEEGNVYWLDISVNTVYGQWGWKSTTNHWNDDAVYADIPVDSTNQWQELYEPPLFEQSLDLAFIIDGEEPEPGYDFGDAPDGALGTGPGDYQTTLADNGAYHSIVVGAPYFDDGSQSDQPDGEPDGQPDLNALGDDNNGTSPDDEDGIVFPVPLVVGQNGSVDITVDDGAGGLSAGGGFVDAWIDWNADGDWTDSNEQIFSGWMPQGLNTVPFTVPAGSVIGQTFARFRINSQSTGLLPTGGPAIDGEVEDHEVYIEEQQLLDWGDAPDPTYPTLAASSGANHLLGQGIYLGASVDPDPDGQPDLQAMGDDTNLLYAGVAYPPGDEDGVIFVTPVFPGTVAQVNVIASVPALLNAWIDFNGDGSWATAGDQVFTDLLLVAGTNSLTIPIPTTAVSGQTFARFRYSTMAGLPPTGYAPDGEVEDHLVIIEEEQGVDWGDAPDPTYPTLLTNNGAHHILLGGFYLGTSIDSDPDGQPNIAASGDDTDGNDDEDGIVYLSNLMPGGCTRVDVAASSPGVLDGWLDFNADGDWLDAGERIFTGQVLNTGTNILTFVVPLSTTNISPASTYMRLRFSSSGVSSFTGLALDGEVEDYKVTILDNYSGDDWGDAPTNFPAGSSTGYPTVGSGGAVHVILTGLQLGGSVDPEINGQPDPTATGDDIVGIDDEDGVVFKTKLIAGNWCTIDVLAGVAGGSLDAWIDFNADGAWSTIEQIANAASLSPGVNTMTFYMPQPSALGQSFARFRLSTAGGLPPAGGAPVSGEVEDYMINLYQPQPYTNIIITNITINTSNAMATIQWNALNNITYQLQMSTNLMSNAWANVGSTIMGPTNSQTNAAVNTTQFYRIEAPWTP